MSLLAELIERDGAACLWCGRELWRSDLTLEHLLPRARGGHSSPENLAVACRRCNRARGARPPVAYVRSIRAAGAEPRLDALESALARLAASERRAHAEYGARHLSLIKALGAEAPAVS